ncbi:MAG: NAD+ synthase [Elusimicrobiaceae bacterium]|nr:NAD+ synthase [Elusimicrobiaceae bacterium]
MKIVLAQLNTTVGDIDGNTRKILAAVKKAARQHAELVIFPEAAITGYPALDLWNDRGFIAANLRALDKLAGKIGDTAALVGYIDFNRARTGNPLQNCAALLHKGKIRARQAKTLLPTYDVFDEDRYFAPALSNKPINFKGVKLGVTICEDVWTESRLAQRHLYRENPVRELMRRQPDLIVNLSASPFHIGKPDLRRELLCGHAKKHGIPFLYCNQVGGNDNLVFDGGSLAVDRAGRVVARGAQFKEELINLEFPFPQNTAPAPDPGISDTEQAARALSLGIGDFVRKCGFSSVILGLSGGIDSAVVAALAVDALGPENVIGVSMPTRYTSGISKNDARELAGNLGLTQFHELPIEGVFGAFTDALKTPFKGMKPDTAEENLQARIRGTMLMAISNKLRALLLATGNKSEFSVGYSTLYGDMNGALAPLGDAPKVLVYDIARWYNTTRERGIPRRTITRAPSAELRPGQTDQDDLPPYETIDPIIAAYIEHNAVPEEIAAQGFASRTVAGILARIDRNEFKRKQAPPVLKITTKAFGTGRRMPIARGYHR